MMSGLDLLPFLDVKCAECKDLGPPPDSILAIPPPPLPAFLLGPPDNHSCGPACDWVPGRADLLEHAEFVIPEEEEYWARPGPPPSQTIGAPLDDTWLMVMVTCTFGVLVLGTLLALFLLRLKQERGGKVALQLDPATTKGCEVLYPAGPDSRLLWATLTPRGTAHHLTAPPVPSKSFENSGYVDPDEYLRVRPRVSQPTRIEHPNLPPLNLHRTLRREASDTAPMV